MADINVKFKHPIDGQLLQVQLNDTITAQDAIAELIEENFILDNPQAYKLAIKKGRKQLDANQSFVTARVRNGAVLSVIFQTPEVRTQSMLKEESLIQELDYAQIGSETEKVVCIDAKNGDERPIGRFKNLARKVRYYSVSTEKTIESSLVCMVKDISNDRALDIYVTYEASCERGNEYKLVKALYHGDYPSDIFNGLIDKWIKEYAREKTVRGIDFISDYCTLHEELKGHISQNARKELGLSLNTHLSLKLEKDGLLIPVEINTDYFHVRVKDCSDYFKLKFKATLSINEENKINSVIAYPRKQQLMPLVQKKIENFFWENVTLQEFVDELNSSLLDRLIIFLNEVLVSEGRKISFLSLERTVNSSLPEKFLSLDFCVDDCTVRDYSPIGVEHKLQMNLENFAKFKAAKIEDLIIWVKTTLDRITKSVLFDKSYAQLIKSFDENEVNKEIPNEIRIRIGEETNQIGYAVQHLLVKPQNVDILILQRDGLSFENQGSFTTYNTDTEVKLSFAIEAKIKTLEKITPYITPKTKVIDEIGNAILGEARQLIHTLDAERFYMRFKHTEVNDEIPVEQALVNKISSKLEEKFGLEEIKVIPKQLETDVITRYKELLQGFESFEFEIFPLGDRGHAEKLKFSLKFKVRSVGEGGWHTFQADSFSRTDQLNSIREILEADLKTKLETIPSSDLQYGDIRDYPAIKKIVDLSIQKIIDVFGLAIEIIIFNRHPTISEKERQKGYGTTIAGAAGTIRTSATLEQLNQENIKAQLEILLERRLKILKQGLDEEEEEEELTTVNERINAIIKDNPSYAIESNILALPERPTQKSSDPLQLEVFHLDNDDKS